MERQTPDLIGARDGYQQHLLIGRQRDAVGAWNVVQKTIEMTIAAQAKHASGRILQAGLPLIREIKVTVRGEDEIVETLEPFAADIFKNGRHGATRRVELHQTTAMIGDEDASVLVNLQTIRPTIILGDHLPIPLG